MDVHGKQWKSMVLYTFPCNFMDVHGYPWILDSGPWQRGGLRFLPRRRQPIWELWTTVEYAGLPATTTTPGPWPTGAPGRRTLLAGPSLHDRQF